MVTGDHHRQPEEPAMTPVSNLKSETIVDRLGNLKADIAKLAKIEKQLVDELK